MTPYRLPLNPPRTMVCPAWQAGNCPQAECDHRGEHLEKVDIHGSMCCDEPLSDVCKPCMEVTR
jgi:hypothetical protein